MEERINVRVYLVKDMRDRFIARFTSATQINQHFTRFHIMIILGKYGDFRWVRRWKNLL